MSQLFEPARQLLIAGAGHSRFIADLQRKHANEIGFLPHQATAWYIEAGCVRIAIENGEPAGMLLGREKFRWQPAMRGIFQAAICFDAQRRHHGLALVEATAEDAREAGQMALQACCREGLEANEFWRIAGFQEICRLDPSAARRRQIIVWRKPLHDTYRPAWFSVPPPVAGHKARKAKVA